LDVAPQDRALAGEPVVESVLPDDQACRSTQAVRGLERDQAARDRDDRVERHAPEVVARRDHEPQADDEHHGTERELEPLRPGPDAVHRPRQPERRIGGPARDRDRAARQDRLRRQRRRW